MSQLLGRIVKLSSSSSSSKQRLCFSKSRSLSTAATPYLLLKDTNLRASRTLSGNERVVDVNLYDPCKNEAVKIADQTLSEELEGSVRIGSSRGWVCVKSLFDSTMCLTNIFNPCASVSSHKVITLPPWDNGSRSRISSISLSASPSQKDCVVAVKSCSHFISMCRLGDSDWTRFHVPFFAPTVMYSVREGRFYLHRARKEVYEGPLDLIESNSHFPQVSLHQSFPNSDIPKSRQDQVMSSIKNEYLVESPSGESFIVYWCDEYFKLNKEKVESCRDKRPPRSLSLRRKPKTFLVFRQDCEQGISSYTEDIGDLCIFLGRNEAFCVSASEYSGLKPNSVYFARIDTGFGIYDLSSNTFHNVIDEAPFSTAYMWLAPLHLNQKLICF